MAPGAAVVLLFGSGCVADEPLVYFEQRLALELEGAHQIPGGWALLDLVALSDSSFAVYLDATPTATRRLAWVPGGDEEIRLPYRSIVGMRRVGPNAVEAVDATRRELLRIERARGVKSGARVPGRLRIWDAAWFNDRWYIASGDSSGAPRIWAFDPESGIVEASEILNDFRAAEVQLGVVEGRAVVSERYYPFRRVEPFGDRETSLFRGADVLSSHGSPGPLHGLFPNPSAVVALPTFSLGGVTIQTIVDVTSTERILLFTDPVQRAARAQKIGIPMAFVGLSPGGKLVGVRRTDVAEIVVYAWSWR